MTKILLILIPLILIPVPIFAANSGDIVINEFSSNSDPEWVELYNPKDFNISLTGWKLKDATQSPKDISSLGEIPAHGFKVFEVGAGWLNNSGGDTLTLLDNNSVTIDTISYGHSGDTISTPSNGKSAGRNPDGSSNWQIFDNPTKGNTNNSSPSQTSTSTSTQTTTTTPSNLKVSLSEIYPAPATGEKEWVEVYNPNSQDVDLSNWKFQDAGGTKKTLEGVIFAKGWKYFEYSSGWLNNSGDTVNLIDPQGNILETFTFGETDKGIAWAKDNSGNWKQTTSPTPGSANQITTPASSSDRSNSKAAAKTSQTTPTANPQVLGKTTGDKSVGSYNVEQNLATPSLGATSSGNKTSSPSAIVEGEGKFNFIPMVIIIVGILILGGAGFKIAKDKGWF